MENANSTVRAYFVDAFARLLHLYLFVHANILYQNGWNKNSQSCFSWFKKSRNISSLIPRAVFVLLCLSSASLFAAPPGASSSFAGWSSDTAVAPTATTDIASPVLGTLDKPEHGKVKGVATRAKGANGKKVKRFKAPAKIAEKHPEMAQEWIVEGMPATQGEMIAERNGRAGKEKSMKRFDSKKHPSPINRGQQ